ncbi:MAG TPA: hypothetical protein VK665_16465 [Candidatus Elarobacter sp.]|nr:hypothetical protein [Candidatus Elarobacter sp.]
MAADTILLTVGTLIAGTQALGALMTILRRDAGDPALRLPDGPSGALELNQNAIDRSELEALVAQLRRKTPVRDPQDEP